MFFDNVLLIVFIVFYNGILCVVRFWLVFEEEVCFFVMVVWYLFNLFDKVRVV